MFKECEKACIYTLDGDFAAEARVESLDQETIGLIFEEKDMEIVNPEVLIVFYDGVEGLVTCRCRLSAVRRISGEMGKAVCKAFCQMEERLGVEQRRRDLKVRVSLPVTLETADAAGKVIRVAASVKNISVGGVGLESSVCLEEKQIFFFTFETPLGSARLKASILWRKELANGYGTSVWQYGCRFFDMAGNEEALVRKFVFQEQLKKRKTEV